MSSAVILSDGFGRVHQLVHRAVQGLSPEQLATRIDVGTNSIAWLIWHLTRIQDDHIADVAGTEQVWIAGGWVDRFGLPFDQQATGYGHNSDDVAAVRVSSGDLLLAYHDATFETTAKYVAQIEDSELQRVVDESYDPPVTLGVRLVSILSDDLQHVGQAAFIRGLIDRR